MMERAIKRNILRSQVGRNKALKLAWRRYQESRGMVPVDKIKREKNISIMKRIMRKIVKLSRFLNRK